MVGRAGTTDLPWVMSSEQLGCRKNEKKPVRDLFPSKWDTWWQCGSSTASGLMMHIEGRGKERRERNRVLIQRIGAIERTRCP